MGPSFRPGQKAIGLSARPTARPLRVPRLGDLSERLARGRNADLAFGGGSRIFTLGRGKVAGAG
jgi:hypothetical protein